MLSRALLLAGAAATLVAAFVPWVTVKGLDVSLDLGLVGADVGVADRTVAGTDTALWPVLVGVALVVAVLALLRIARRLLLALGVLIVLAGAGLLVYMANVIDFETRGDDVQRVLGDALLSSSVGPGTPLLLCGGLAIVAGALLKR